MEEDTGTADAKKRAEAATELDEMAALEEHENKFAANLQMDSLEERLYLHLNRWKKTAGLILVAWFGFIFFTIFAASVKTSFEPVAVGLVLILFGSFFAWEVQRRRSRSIQNEYERRQYFLILSSMEGEGETPLEKFMDLAIRVFPSLKQVARKHGFSKDWWLEETKKRGETKYDIAVRGKRGVIFPTWFLVKRFDKTVTFADIANLYVEASRKRNILRIVVIAKVYDQSFFTDEFEGKMKELLFWSTGTGVSKKKLDKMKKEGTYEDLRQERVKYHSSELDLLIEHENGFSPLWLS